jgi:ABC-type sugar transport system substrate-binding protein
MNPFFRLLFVGLLACCARAYGAGLLIGFSQVTLQSPFYVELKEGAEAAAKPAVISSFSSMRTATLISRIMIFRT